MVETPSRDLLVDILMVGKNPYSAVKIKNVSHVLVPCVCKILIFRSFFDFPQESFEQYKRHPINP